MNDQTCPVCGIPLVRGVRKLELNYKGQSASFDMPGWYCESCSEGVHSGSDMEVSDRQLNLLKAAVEDLLLPVEVRRIRKKLHLSQEVAGRVLGGGPNAFHRYESGSVLPSRAISSLLRVLDASPDALQVLIRNQPTNAPEQSRPQAP